MSPHYRKAKRVISQVLASLTAAHGDCGHPLCTWRLVRRGDAGELANALVAAGYAIVPTSQIAAMSTLAVTVSADELWSSQQVAAYRGIEPGSVRKAMHRLGIRERRGYPAHAVLAAWPQTEQEVPA